jgi:hypothetical protein
MSQGAEITKRRTFAIISHPDAGKTTLTEKFLLFGGAIQTAGAVKSNKILMKWITRERPKIDRIACPWLIKNFVDKDAEFIYVPFDQVISKSAELAAIPFDLPNVEYTHYGDECTFDYIIKKHNLTDPALRIMAVIVRAADTDRHDIAPQSSGLWAISAGLAENIKDDYELLNKGMMIYDGLYT